MNDKIEQFKYLVLWAQENNLSSISWAEFKATFLPPVKTLADYNLVAMTAPTNNEEEY